MKQTQTKPMDPVTIGDKSFAELMAVRCRKLLALADYVSKRQAGRELFTRPLLGELLSQSMQMEELLDTYDARNNCQWCMFRSLVAALKQFSDVSYELLHIQHALPAYRLLPIDHDFYKATEGALRFSGGVLHRACCQIVERAEQLNLSVPELGLSEQLFAEQLPPGRLPHNCSEHKRGTVAEMVTLLATAFLNLAAESEGVRAAGRAKPEQYISYTQSVVREEKLRSLELRFHNLQSQYDTYVSGTEAEKLDSDLPVLRGHISVVFHLLKTATLLAHYYERHVNKQPCKKRAGQPLLVSAESLLGVLMNYAILHISLYIDCAEHLCQEMLKRYAEVGEIEVSVPRYRGFHVRPSTLVSKIVLHYGSDVRMEMEGEAYDASSPLELFRANEKINAEKRRWLVQQIVEQKLIETADTKELRSLVRDIVSRLAEQKKLILYEQPLELPAEPARSEGTLLEKVTDELARLLALGKIDIEAKLAVRFVGDKRVLADIKLLAESGYGEDNFGNNIPLPEKLVYLRRQL